MIVYLEAKQEAENLASPRLASPILFVPVNFRIEKRRHQDIISFSTFYCRTKCTSIYIILNDIHTNVASQSGKH